MSSEDEFPPLLQPGLHKMSVDELKTKVVDAFPLSGKRPQLWQHFIEVLDQIKKAGLKGEIWVDGSFLTEKINPGDVDFVFDVPVHLLEKPTPQQEELLHKLADKGFKKTERLHTFVMFSAPVVHSQYAESVRLHTQWQKDFGFSYVDKTPKGIAVLEVQP
jgi:hypothetical protein